MNNKVVIFGNGDISDLAYYYFTNDTSYDIAAFTVDGKYCKSDTFNKLPNIPFENLPDDYPPDEYKIFVAVSYAKMNAVRTEKVQIAKSLGYEIANYVSTHATVFPDLSSNENCFILEDNTIQPFVRIGNNVTLWSGNHIGHHSVIGDNCFITSHVVVSGGVHVGCNSFIGVNSTLHDHIKIADHTLIGAGALVTKDTEEYGVYIGAPAKKIKIPSTKVKL